MNQYHKIQTVFKRDPETKFKTLLQGEYSIPEFEYLKDCIWDWTEKVDGTNIRVMWNGMGIKFGGKTDNAQIPATLFMRLQELFPIEKMKEVFAEDDDICLYGEGYGAKIQKGGGNYLPDGQSFCLFDIKVGRWWLRREDVIDIAKQLKIIYAPLIGQGTLYQMVNKTLFGFNSTWGDFKAEGIVARPTTELIARNGHRIITKIKHKDFINNKK